MKFINLVLAAFLAIAVTACGDDKSDDTGVEDTAVETGDTQDSGDDSGEAGDTGEAAEDAEVSTPDAAVEVEETEPDAEGTDTEQ